MAIMSHKKHDINLLAGPMATMGHKKHDINLLAGPKTMHAIGHEKPRETFYWQTIQGQRLS